MNPLTQHPVQQPQPPIIDINQLGEEYEILFDYDSNGNLRSVRKTRRGSGCSGLAAILLVAGAAFLAYCLWGGP